MSAVTEHYWGYDVGTVAQDVENFVLIGEIIQGKVSVKIPVGTCAGG